MPNGAWVGFKNKDGSYTPKWVASGASKSAVEARGDSYIGADSVISCTDGSSWHLKANGKGDQLDKTGKVVRSDVSNPSVGTTASNAAKPSAKPTNTGTVLGQGKTNPKKGSHVDVMADVDHELLYLDPRNNEIIHVEAKDSLAVLTEVKTMAELLENLTTAKEEIAKAQAEIAKANATFPVTNTKPLEAKLDKARRKFEQARKDISAKVDKDHIAGKGKSVLELIPLAKAKGKDGSRKVAAMTGAKWTYVRSDKIKNHFRQYQLNAKDAKSQPKSFVVDGKIDHGKLKEQLNTLELKFKADWKINDSGFIFPELQQWAETLNGSKGLVRNSNNENIVTFDYGAQLFRYFAGAALETTWDPAGGKIAGNASAKAEMLLANGKAKLEGNFPNENGWALSAPNVFSGEMNLIGHFKATLELVLEASAGASAACDLGIEIETEALTGKSLIKGAKLDKKTSTQSPAKVSTDELGAKVQADADIFAGVRAGGEIKGALKFKNPEQDGKFESLAGIAPALGLSAGIGAGGVISLTFVRGKFRILAKAALCLGLGAQGKLELEVGLKQIGSFLYWTHHALLNTNYSKLDWITGVGFTSLTQAGVLFTAGVSNAYSNISSKFTDFVELLDTEAQRAKLANQIVSNPKQLRFNTPEAQGILIHHLTRHGKLTLLDIDNWSMQGLDIEVLGTRKEAIVQILRCAQSKSHFENIVQHISATGSKGGFRGNLNGILRFMEIGPRNSTYDDKVRAMYQALPSVAARGYPIAMNDSPAFAQAAGSDSPLYVASMQSGDGNNSNYA